MLSRNELLRFCDHTFRNTFNGNIFNGNISPRQNLIARLILLLNQYFSEHTIKLTQSCAVGYVISAFVIKLKFYRNAYTFACVYFST